MKWDDMLKINWSVWDSNPVVAWEWNGAIVSIRMKIPPSGVCDVESRKLMAIVGNFNEFSSSNLLLYSYEGILQRVFTAPDLGNFSQFSSVSEWNGSVSVSVAFEADNHWEEKAAKFNIDNGAFSNFHRHY